jgi:cysteinyl-tRNA synthetase
MRAEIERIESLIAERTAARANKDWRESDRLREELAKEGVAIQDNKGGPTTWELMR